MDYKVNGLSVSKQDFTEILIAEINKGVEKTFNDFKKQETVEKPIEMIGNIYYEIFREYCYGGVFCWADRFREILNEPIDCATDETWNDIFKKYDGLKDKCYKIFNYTR
jgi:hypothetical protein